MSNTPHHPPSDPHGHPQGGSFTPAGPSPQPVFTPAGGTHQGFSPVQPPPGFPASHTEPAGVPAQPPPPGFPASSAASAGVPLLPHPQPPRPVPPVSSPAAPKLNRPSRNPIVRLILWFTEPSMLKGMAMGVILALIVGVAIRLEAMWYVISGLLLILFVCLFGVIIGHYVFEARRKKLQARGLEVIREAGTELPALSDDVMTMLWSRDRSQLPVVWDRLRRIKPAVEEIGGLTIAVVFRTMAMSALFAVLGAAISFAVFLTSFMQVERMTEQNKLIHSQIAQTDKQMAFEANAAAVAVALSIAESRQSTLRDLVGELKNSKELTPCGPEVPASRLGGRKRCLSDAAAQELATFIALLQPYRPVEATADGNSVAPFVRSPEQQQFLRHLSGNNIEVGNEALDLSTAFLDHADLSGTALERVHLRKVPLRHARLNDADFSGADLAGADLTLATASRVRLVNAVLTDANLTRANFVGADLTEANLVRVKFIGTALRGAVFTQAKLGSAELHGAQLTDVNLAEADLTGADLALANLEGARLPPVPKVREAAFWWLGVYSADYAGKLGLDAAAQQRNAEALKRWSAAPDEAAAAAIVAELKSAAPNAPA